MGPKFLNITCAIVHVYLLKSSCFLLKCCRLVGNDLTLAFFLTLALPFLHPKLFLQTGISQNSLLFRKKLLLQWSQIVDTYVQTLF